MEFIYLFHSSGDALHPIEFVNKLSQKIEKLKRGGVGSIHRGFSLTFNGRVPGDLTVATKNYAMVQLAYAPSPSKRSDPDR